MSTTTFTVTVVSTDDGNKYYIDGVRQDTVFFSKTATYRFDQSDSSNEYHPLRLSTTENGTHAGGSAYTTGVTTSGTPGNSGAYTEITVASDAPDSLYYYCSNHSGMGGAAFIGESTWGNNTWNANSWQSGVSLATLTGVSSTTSVGTPDVFPETGWGSDSWGDENWGESSIDVTLSSAGVGTTAIGSVTVTAEINTGWGRAAWNDDAWGIQGDILLEGVQATASVGSLIVGDILGLTGVSSTASVGAPTIIGDITQALTGVSATTSVGSITPADVMGLTGVSATASVGSISPADVMGVTGVSATTSIGSITTSASPVIQPSGFGLTSSVGSITPADVIGLTGVSATASVGTLTPADVMGLTGVSATASVAGFGTSSGFGIQAYQDVDTGSNTTYSDAAQKMNFSNQEIKKMASTYTGLGVELQATGENAGTWGTKTNTNLQLLEQISGGFTQQAVTSGGTVNLAVSDGSTGATLAHRMIEFTGSLSDNAVVTIPLDVQTFYFLRNSTSGAYTVQFKYVTGSGDSFTFGTTDKGDQLVFASANDGTNPDIITLAFGDGDVTLTGTQTLTNKTLTAPKIADAGFIADANGNEQIIFQTTTSAVNELEVTNAATGNPPILGASGESNVDVHIKPKGTGETRIGTGAANATLTSSGAHDLILDTNSGTNSGTITITDGADGNITIAPNGTGVAQAVDAGDNTAAIKIAGKETIWVPAIAMYPNSTSGAEAAQVELSNGPEIKVLDFDKSSDEFAQFAVAFPKSWNAGTVTFQAFFTATSTDTGTTSWALQGVALADNGDLNTAFGTAVAPTAKAHSGTSNDLDVTAESGAVTIAGSPGDDEYVFFQISRDVSADDLDADARLLGIKLFFTTDLANDA